MIWATEPRRRATARKGWLRAHRWWLLRRASQLTLLGLFLLGPWLGIWIVRGNLASSVYLDTLRLTDPFITLQSLLAGHVPSNPALIGAATVLLVYALVGGRAYCSWVCPINIVTDTAFWLRRRLGLVHDHQMNRRTRLWVFGSVLVASAVTGTIAWEYVNPITMLHRGMVFGMGLAWGIVAAVFLLDLLISRRAWCGHICPVGVFYGLVGTKSVVRVSAKNRARCDDCMACFSACGEPHVITPALRGEKLGRGPVILARDCTNCGTCIDVCPQNVFAFSTRFHNSVPDLASRDGGEPAAGSRRRPGRRPAPSGSQPEWASETG